MPRQHIMTPPKRKLRNIYFFSVEGETEKWYLEWLKDTINESQSSIREVVFDCKVEKDPVKRAKSITIFPIRGKTEIWHFTDYESNKVGDTKQFTETINKMVQATKLGKQITYKLGYSNLTFDLWIILHKMDCFGSLADRRHYCTHLNQAYGEKFVNMPEYKMEKNFKRCLAKLNLSNVKDAVRRAKEIMRQRETGDHFTIWRGFKYYKKNPSLAIWEIIEKILEDCQLLEV